MGEIINEFYRQPLINHAIECEEVSLVFLSLFKEKEGVLAHLGKCSIPDVMREKWESNQQERYFWDRWKQHHSEIADLWWRIKMFLPRFEKAPVPSFLEFYDLGARMQGHIECILYDVIQCYYYEGTPKNLHDFSDEAFNNRGLPYTIGDAQFHKIKGVTLEELWEISWPIRNFRGGELEYLRKRIINGEMHNENATIKQQEAVIKKLRGANKRQRYSAQAKGSVKIND